MKEPTKADLAAAVAKLTEENKGMRDLLAAISLAAGTVPVSQHNDYLGEWKRSTKVLANIKTASHLDDWAGRFAYWSAELRAVAAELPGYEVYEPEDAEPEPLVISDSTIEQAEFFEQPGNTIDDILAAQRSAS